MQNDFTRRGLFGGSRTKEATLAGHSLVAISKTERLLAAGRADDTVITRYQKMSLKQKREHEAELREIVNRTMTRLDNALAVLVQEIKEPKKLDKDAFRKLLFDKREHNLLELEKLYYQTRMRVAPYICARCGNLKFSFHEYCGECSDDVCDYPLTRTKRLSNQIYFLLGRTHQYVHKITKQARFFFNKYRNPEGVRMHADTLYDIESGNLALTPRWLRV